MRMLATAAVCIGVLYAVDMIWFNGWYFSVAVQIINNAWSIIR
jgi:hypothetical protein